MEGMEKQTAVELLYNFLYEWEEIGGFDPGDFQQEKLFEFFKKLERKQIKEAFIAGRTTAIGAQKYYNETFKSE
jgi:hypothetical protein